MKALQKALKNVFYIMLKAPFVLNIFTFLSRIFSYVEKHPDKKAKVNFKIYNVADWATNNCNIYIGQYFRK